MTQVYTGVVFLLFVCSHYDRGVSGLIGGDHKQHFRIYQDSQEALSPYSHGSRFKRSSDEDMDDDPKEARKREMAYNLWRKGKRSSSFDSYPEAIQQNVDYDQYDPNVEPYSFPYSDGEKRGTSYSQWRKNGKRAVEDEQAVYLPLPGFVRRSPKWKNLVRYGKRSDSSYMDWRKGKREIKPEPQKVNLLELVRRSAGFKQWRKMGRR